MRNVSESQIRYAPGRVRDAIFQVLSVSSKPLSIRQIQERVSQLIGPTPTSSVRSYLRLNTPQYFVRQELGVYSVHGERGFGIQQPLVDDTWKPAVRIGKAQLVHADCFDWLEKQENNSFHAVLTDPPYGLHEYTPEQQAKLRSGKGGVWRIPPSFDGHVRSPLPRFTTLTTQQLEELRSFFFVWARLLLPKVVPGAHVIVASNPLLSYIVAGALADAGLERRGEIIRLVMTMRGGDRPKAAHKEFQERQRHAPLDVGAMARQSQTLGRSGPGQSAKMENRWTPPPVFRTAIWRRDTFIPNAKNRTIYGSAS